MSPAQRRIVLAMLVGLLAFLATLQPSGEFPLAPKWLDVHILWMGLYFTSLTFVATWLTLSPRPLVERFPGALGLGALLGLAQAWSSHRYSLENPFSVTLSLFVALVVLVAVTGVMGIWRRRYGWRIALGREEAVSPGRRRQFSLRQMCAWMTGTAVVLALARWIEPPHSNTVPVAETVMEFLMSGGLALGGTVLGLPLMVPCVGLVLAERDQRRFAFWVAAMAVVVGGLLFAVFFLADCLANAPVDVLEVGQVGRQAAAQAGSFELGLLGVALGGLGVLRSCGYRLIRLKNRAGKGAATPEGTLSADALPGEAIQRRWWQSSFARVVVAMAGVAGVLCWPAWRIDMAKRKEALLRSLAREWKDMGASETVLYDGGLQVEFGGSEPWSAAALTKLCQPAAAESLVRLNVAYTALTEDDMRCLSGLRLLKHLDLTCTAITDPALEHLRGLTRLEGLSLRHARVTDKGMDVLAELKGLRWLDLEGTTITDAGLTRLHALRRLEVVNLWETGVTAQGVARLREALPNCRVYHPATKPR